MTRMYDYKVCNVQSGHVTFVNGDWQGHVSLAEAAGASDPFASCPEVWSYLQQVWPDGWELAATVVHTTPETSYDVLYLKREL